MPGAHRRDQCRVCPWRDPGQIEERFQQAARGGASFVCHTRMGPCDGPNYAGLTDQIAEAHG